MAAIAGVEPTTLRLNAIDSTKAPPCPTNCPVISIYCYTVNGSVLPAVSNNKRWYNTIQYRVRETALTQCMNLTQPSAVVPSEPALMTVISGASAMDGRLRSGNRWDASTIARNHPSHLGGRPRHPPHHPSYAYPLLSAAATNIAITDTSHSHSYRQPSYLDLASLTYRPYMRITAFAVSPQILLSLADPLHVIIVTD